MNNHTRRNLKNVFRTKTCFAIIYDFYFTVLVLQWYMQNRELKRKSAVLVQKFLKESPVSIADFADEADAGPSTDNELENLMKTIKSKK